MPVKESEAPILETGGSMVLPSLLIGARAAGSDGHLKTNSSPSPMKIQAAMCLE